VDLSAAEQIDTACLAALVIALRHMKKQDGTLVLIGVNDRIRRLLRLTHLESAFEYAPTRDTLSDSARVADSPETFSSS